MKKFIWLPMTGKTINLQLFAEDPAAGTDPAPATTEPAAAEPKATEPKATEPAKKYSDADIDRIIGQKFAEWQKKKDKEVDEATKLAQMNSEQKAQYQNEQLQKQNEDLAREVENLKRDAAKAQLAKTAAGLLKEHQIDATDDVLAFVVGEDAEKTKANIDRFVGIMEEQIKRAETARATGVTPRSYGNTAGSVSEIDKRIAKYQ